MDDFHHRDNWPFVSAASREEDEPVSPQEHQGPELELNRRKDDDSGISDEEAEGTSSPIEVSPVQSLRNSLDQERAAVNGTGDLKDQHPPPRPKIDELYEDDDEERDVITPIPASGPNGNGETPNPFETAMPNGVATPTPTTQSRPISAIKTTPPSRTLPRRTPSITAQIPMHRQRVRYSWQSVQDEEPNRPRIHVIKLVSNTATASAGFPQGEALSFSISPFGRRVAAYNSARLYILQSQALPVGISQDYALKRRPLAVEVVDEGNAIAILADEHTVNVYDLEEQVLRRIKTIKLDFPCSCIALSPTGALLAAAYEGGVEIFSLHPNALPTDRRAVRSHKVDRLMFSKDGSTLIGTTTRINASSTVVISVPVFPTSPNGIPTHEELKEAWCSGLLQPDNIRNSSHATFMREDREHNNDRLFAWNGLQETFGILKVSDMMYSNVDFPVVINPPLSTLGGLGAAIHCCPDVDEHGDAVAMVVNDRTIRLYLVPKRSDDSQTIIEAHSIDHELDEGYGCPFSDIRWVQSGDALPPPDDVGAKQVRGRLLVASPGAVIEPEMNEEMVEVEDLEGGRIIMFDFDPQYIGQPGQTFSLTLGNSPPQTLEEPDIDVAHEVAIIRRRTVNQNKSSTLNQRPITLGRSATSTGNRSERVLRTGTPTIVANSARRSVLLAQPETNQSSAHLAETTEGFGTFEEPYAQNAPRSQVSLQRAASNAQRHRFQALEEKNQENVSVDSSGNFLPLPEYTEEPNAPLPSRFRAMAGLDGPSKPPAAKPRIVTTSSGERISPGPNAPSTAPVTTAETFSAEEALAAARNAQVPQTSREEQAVEPPANGSPSSDTRPSSRPTPTDPVPPMSRSDTFQSLPPMNPRFIQRAYANAAFNPLATGPPPRLMGDWESTAPLSTAQMERTIPPASQMERTIPPGATLDAVSQGVHGQEQWNAVSPLPSTNPSSPLFPPRGPAPGQQYRFSTSQVNPPGHSPVHHETTALPRAPSSAGSFAPSSSSSPGASFRDMRLPPHMQAFRNAAAANAAGVPYHPHSQSVNQIPIIRESSPRQMNGSGYPITAWHPPAPSSAPPTSHSMKDSISNHRAAPSPTLKSKNSGFFRSGTKKKKTLLFGPEFANKQPGARPGTSDSEDYGAKSMFETKSIFTVKTKRGETRCTVM